MTVLNTPSRIWPGKFASVAFFIMLPLLFVSSEAAGNSNASRHRALILGGGGPVGEAWESGVIAGLMEKGIDLSHADLIIGTSAGAIVGARLASGMPAADIIDAALAPSDAPPPQGSNSMPAGPPPDLSFLGRKLDEMWTGNRPQQSIRAEIGQWALKVHPVTSELEFIASYQHRFPKKEWPNGSYECVSVEAENGSLHIWNKSSELPVALAVASSCALPGVFAPIAINAHHYMDGGVRSVTNADLARGCKEALVLAPTSGLNDPLARSFTRPLNNEMQTLRDSGCKVELIAPDRESLAAFGASIGDEHHRAPALDAGRVEGRSKGDEISGFWNHQ